MTDISRRKAIKTIGATAVATAIGVKGIETLAAQISDKKTAKDMKVLLINGSPRKAGNTNRMLEEIASQLDKNGIQSEIFQIGVDPVRGCIACGQCAGKGRCVFDDICNRALEKMTECDGIIVGSPVYYGVPAGPVLSLLQRMAYSGSRVMQGKPAAAITVCRRGGGTSAFQTLQMPFQMLNMPIVTSQYWNIAYGSGPGEVEQDAEGMQTMRTLAHNMAFMLRAIAAEKAKSGLPEREEWQPMHFIR